MRQSLFRFFALALGLIAINAQGQVDTVETSRYDKHITKYTNYHTALIPKYIKAQFAGSIGMVSVGLGWDYGKNRRWETDILMGLVPRLESNRAKMTFTLRENLVPWDVAIGRTPISFSPLRASAGVNAIIGHEFWPKNPERYPEGYYFFSTKFQFVVGFGQQWTLNIGDERRRLWKSIGVFYDLSTNDKYVLSGFGNREVGFFDVFHLDIGVKLLIL